MTRVNHIYWVGIFGVLLVVMAYVIQAMVTGVSALSEARHECESKGGVLLRRTYSLGGKTRSTYTCVRSDALIELVTR